MPFRNNLCVRPHNLAPRPPADPPILCDRCAEEEMPYLPKQQLALKLEEEAEE